MASACSEALSDWKELPPDRGLRLGPCEPPGPAQPQERSGALWPITTLLACLGHPFPSPSCRHRRGHVPADLQTEHFVSLQRANPATWGSAFCLMVAGPACPILCQHGSSFSCHLRRKRTDHHSVSDWASWQGAALFTVPQVPCLCSTYCLSSVKEHCLTRKGDCAACDLAPVVWGCALCIEHL